MITIENERVIFFDVDDTLILWEIIPGEETITFKCAFTGDFLQVIPHLQNITLLKEKHARGYTVVVWSQGGFAHAQAVVKALGLEQHVALCMNKPSCYVDDLDANAWMPKRVYLDYKKRYKNAKARTNGTDAPKVGA